MYCITACRPSGPAAALLRLPPLLWGASNGPLLPAAAANKRGEPVVVFSHKLWSCK